MDLGSFGRIPLEAEQSVLGAILLDKEVVTEIISSQDFYREDHREIFEAIMDLYEKGEPIDLITVALKVRGSLEAVGGLEYLTNLASLVLY